MRKHITAALLLCGAACIFLPGAATAAENRVGVLGPVAPTVHITMPDGSVHEAVTGEDAVVGEKIVTEANGMTEILFLDRSSLRIGANSEITVDDFSYSSADGTGKLNVNARQGLLRFNGGALSKEPGRVTVRTPAAIMGIRGAIALIAIGDGGESQATLLFGNAITLTGTGGLTGTITRVGFSSSVPAGGGAPTPQAPASSQQLNAALAKLNARGAPADSASANVPIDAVVSPGPQSAPSLGDVTSPMPLAGPPPGANVSNQLNATIGGPKGVPPFVQQPIPHGGVGEPGMGVNAAH